MLLSPDHSATCTFVELESAAWPLPKMVLVIFELLIIIFVNALLPKLFKDLLNSGRLPVYLKFLLGVLFGAQWMSEMLRVAQLLIMKPDAFRPYLPFYVHTFLGREISAYAQAILFLLILSFLFGEISSLAFRSKINKFWIALPVCILTLVVCTLFVVTLNLIDISLESMFLLKLILIGGLFQTQFYVARQAERTVKRPEHGKKGYLIAMQRNYRRAARGIRYMRLQLKMCFILFLANSTATLIAYYIALPQCSSTWLQINIQFGEFANTFLFVITLFNCSHYMGGKIHRLIAKFLPSQKIGSTASTEPLYYNTEMLNPQEAHFKQLSIMWTTHSSAYPQYYTPVNLATSMSV